MNYVTEEEILKLKNSGFEEDSAKVKLSETYNQNLVWAKQKIMTDREKYDFYRGIEFACGYLLIRLKKEVL